MRPRPTSGSYDTYRPPDLPVLIKSRLTMLFPSTYMALALLASLLTSSAQAGLILRPDEIVGSSAEQAAQVQMLDVGAADFLRNRTAAPVRVNITLGVMSR